MTESAEIASADDPIWRIGGTQDGGATATPMSRWPRRSVREGEGVSLLEKLKDERRRLIGLRQDGDARLLEDLGAHEGAHRLRDVGVGDAAIGRGGVLRSDGDGA